MQQLRCGADQTTCGASSITLAANATTVVTGQVAGTFNPTEILLMQLILLRIRNWNNNYINMECS
jgi:hypothetical protein